MMPPPPPEMPRMEPPRAPTWRDLKALTLMARQSLAEAVRAPRPGMPVQTFLKIIEDTEAWAAVLEKADAKPGHAPLGAPGDPKGPHNDGGAGPGRDPVESAPAAAI